MPSRLSAFQKNAPETSFSENLLESDNKFYVLSSGQGILLRGSSLKTGTGFPRRFFRFQYKYLQKHHAAKKIEYFFAVLFGREAIFEGFPYLS